jgi:hypothetical protein
VVASIVYGLLGLPSLPPLQLGFNSGRNIIAGVLTRPRRSCRSVITPRGAAPCRHLRGV